MASKYSVYKEDVKRLHAQTKSDKEISEILNIDARRVSDLRKKLGLKTFEKWEHIGELVPTKEQEQALIGGLIGDMCIFKDKNAVNYRMNLAHSTKQEEYFWYKYKILKPLLFQEPKKREWIDKRTNNEYKEIKTQSLTHKFFSDLYDKWYFAGKKIMPDDIYKMEALGLAIWYLDDGCKGNDHNRYFRYTFATSSYDLSDVKRLMDMLDTNFGIKTSYQRSRNNILVIKESHEHFIETIKPYVVSTMTYKL